ncbi:hypothetical protein L486_00226 [Kwoniella mangroviensis CBS 10435]|uniref:Uncharacterized protein n=1 Tax=Kwoniella mangroviensis CBS 10435 TaxID=1331196 RepID=A0A1B9IYI9_9TREE|nr:uncharacterized protein I203_00905 [Kwoniella mangroviensis CBS 8507]OCF60591.1 hypothetical protein L486_00226 [Kwoniella mangroviensis CBS 10435]OCF70768.1 hypothetical protein I203_00905 [Kwoniella mangroviensis CBS 8507]OCF74660.1 hypothetical protein I204_05040 [Kwoniella mangroviensis CBS 8886]
METPNTRSRRKRELENSSQEDGLRVAWVHDSQLRKAVLQATEDDVISPPTPTQRPRPISSLLKSSSSSSTSEPSKANRPPRKRPCRGHRSLPTSIQKPTSSSTGNTTGESSGSGSNSLPNMSILSSCHSTSSEKTRLDYLLDRFSLLSSPMDEDKTNNSSKKSYMDVETPSRNLRPRNTTSIKDKPMIITSTPLKKRNGSISTSNSTSTSNVSSHMKPNPKSRSNPNIEPIPIPLLHQSKSIDVPHPNVPQDKGKGIFTSKPPSTSTTTTHRNPLSPIKGTAPRIGLGSQHKPKSSNTSVTTTTITSNRTGGWTRTNSGKAFRTPFLDSTSTGGVRSSPRKEVLNGVVPVRGQSALPSTRPNNTTARPNISNTSVSPNKRPRPVNPRSNTSASESSSLKSSLPPTPPAPPVEVGFKNYDVGENDPEDTSFDSFDGIFASGGEEIERLLRSVDGST